MVSLFRQVGEILKPFKALFPTCRLTYFMLTVSPNLSVRGFRTTPKGLTTQGLSPGGNNVTAFPANISATAPETKSRCSADEGALAIFLANGAATAHSRRYPSSIQTTTTELRTNVLQNAAQLETLPRRSPRAPKARTAYPHPTPRPRRRNLAERSGRCIKHP